MRRTPSVAPAVMHGQLACAACDDSCWKLLQMLEMQGSCLVERDAPHWAVVRDRQRRIDRKVDVGNSPVEGAKGLTISWLLPTLPAARCRRAAFKRPPAAALAGAAKARPSSPILLKQRLGEKRQQRVLGRAGVVASVVGARRGAAGARDALVRAAAARERDQPRARRGRPAAEEARQPCWRSLLARFHGAGWPEDAARPHSSAPSRDLEA